MLLNQTKRAWTLPIILVLACCLSCKDESNGKAAAFVKGSEEHIQSITGQISDESILSADENQGDWLSYGRNYSEDRYSELNQLTRENIAELDLAWAVELGTNKGLQATPLAVDGILFFTGPYNNVYAYDARTGKEIWHYKPDFDPSISKDLCCGVSNRGLAIYEGALFMGTLDGKLISIDAATGTPNWEVNTLTEEGAYTITGAPRIAKGKVLIGNGGAETFARGYITAYDAGTGELVWRFYTVPGDPSKEFEHPDLQDAAKTWSGKWWENGGGGGTVWDAIVYDPEFNNVYIGVGNGAHWDRQIRSPEGGDNLYLSSIVAVDADSGAYKWHYQTTPGDTWDYTAAQHIILAELAIDGKARKVLMQAPKNGYFYVIDRSDGAFISANNYTYQNWTTGMDDNGRPIEAKGARYTDGKVHWITPSSHGGHNWPPMSYNHETGLVYIPTAKNSDPYLHTPGRKINDPHAFMGGGGANVTISNKLYYETVLDTHPDAPIPGVGTGRLVAWDPVAQKEVWGVDQIGLYNGGLLTTSTGLLFQGDAEGMFTVRDVKDGTVLKQFDLRSGIVAPPITYLVDGEQFVTILVGWGGHMAKFHKHVGRIHPGTIYTFKLGGDAPFPEKLPAAERPLTQRITAASDAVIGNGWNVYSRFCIACHTMPGSGHTSNPDLARSQEDILDNYEEIVKNGLLSQRGMPAFGDAITLEELDDLKNFIYFMADHANKGTPQSEVMGMLAGMQAKADEQMSKRESSE